VTQTIGTAIEPYNGDDDDNEHEVIEAEAEIVSNRNDSERKPVFATTYTVKDSERRPLVPAWVRNPDERREMLRNKGGHGAYVVAWHASRALPVHLPRTIGYTVRGAHRTVRGFTGWAFDREHAPVRAEAIRSLQLAEARSQYRQRSARVKWRGSIYWSTWAVAIAAVSVGWALGATWQRYLGLVVVAGILAYVGRPIDRPAYTPAIVRARYAKLTAELVEGAIIAAGLAKVDKDGRHGIDWIDPCQRDGAGWLAVIDLPKGVTVGSAIDARESIASGLHVPAERLWIERDNRSERRVRIWVGDRAMREVAPPAWPLLRAGKVDLFGEWPFAVTARGRIAHMCLMFTSVLAGGAPRMGKSFALRLMLLAAALDPTAEIHGADMKGGSDLLCLEPVAHTLIVGDDPEDLEHLVYDLRAVQREMKRRYGLLRQMARDHDMRAPEGKVSRELADDKQLGLHPIVYALDECQIAFAKSNQYGEETEEIVTDLVKRGPAAGVTMLLGTQRPDKESVPVGIRDNVQTRFALRVMTGTASDMVLGGGESIQGHKAHHFGRSDLGVGWLKDATPTSGIEVVRSYYIDQPTAEVVVARARALRERAGTLSGEAAGIATVKRSSLLDDALSVMPDRTHMADLAATLSTTWTDTYAGMDATRLAGLLRGQGVAVKQTKVGGINRAGVTRREIERVIAARERDTD